MKIVFTYNDLNDFLKNIQDIKLVYYVPMGAKSRIYENKKAYLLFLSSLKDGKNRDSFMLPVRDPLQGYSETYNSILSFVEDETGISIGDFTNDTFYYLSNDIIADAYTVLFKNISIETLTNKSMNDD